MTIKISDACANAILDSGYDTLFDGGRLEIRSGAVPADANAVNTGSKLAAVDPLPANAFAAASGRTKAKAGTWQDAAADAAGTATYYRLVQQSDNGAADSTQIRQQGTVGLTGSGADMELDNTNIQPGQPVTITAFSVSL